MTITRDALLANCRVARNEKLAQSDISMLRVLESATTYSAFTTARADWVTYRQALRDYPSTIPAELKTEDKDHPNKLTNVPEMPLSPDETQAVIDAEAEAKANATAAAKLIKE